MQDETNPNPAMSQAPLGANPVDLMPQAPVIESPVVPPSVDVSPQIPQSQDNSDAMTYPLGSQDAQPEIDLTTPVSVEDHRTILDRIMGIFSKGKKEQSENVQPVSIDQTPTNTIPPLNQ